MRIIKKDKETAIKAVEVLKKGGLVIYPTETLYGIGADATNFRAVKKLTAYKNRPFGKPYSIAVTDKKMAEEYVELNSTARNLYKEFLPGPVTIVSRGKHKVARGVESEDGTLGIRIPDVKLVTEIVKKLAKPITATSANASYKKRPYSVTDVLENISEKQKKLIDLIIDAGQLPHKEPSTVIDTTLDDPVTLRQGEIKLTNKNELLSRSEENTKNIAKELWQKYEAHMGKRAIVFALQGEMGAGKTIFTKGLAQAMDIRELVTSPTFALENEYGTGSKKLFHFDAWRLEGPSEMHSLGFDELIKGNKVLSIEWAERVSSVIRQFDDSAIIVWVELKFGKGDNDRLISWGVSK